MRTKTELIQRAVKWRPDAKQCYYLFLALFFIALLRDPLEQVVHPVCYIDELLALCAVPLFFMECMRNKPTTLFQQGGYARYIVAFWILGLVSSLIYHYQPFGRVALVDMFLCIKFWLAIYVGKVVFEHLSLKDYADKIYLCIRVTVWIFAILILADYLVWILNSGNSFFYGEIRVGIKSVKLFYSHSSVFAASCAFMMAVIAAIGDYVKGSRKYLLVLGIMMGLTLRSKALGAAIIVALLYICVYFWKKKLNLKILIGCIPILLIIGAYQIYFYFFSSLQDESARYQLMIKSIEIAADHFPLGAGFGTFASYISSEWYSPIYEMYGLSHVWGLEQGKAYFVSDNFWPMILGQTGWLGLICFGLAVILLFLRIQKLYEVRKGLYLSGLIILAYLLIASVAESAFAHPVAIPFAVWLGILMKEE